MDEPAVGAPAVPAPGRVIALTGPPGAGQSTLAGVLGPVPVRSLHRQFTGIARSKHTPSTPPGSTRAPRQMPFCTVWPRARTGSRRDSGRRGGNGEAMPQREHGAC